MSSKNNYKYSDIRKSSGYVQGSAVKKTVNADPFSTYEKSFRELEEKKREKARQQKQIKRENRWNFIYTIGVIGIAAITFGMCFNFLDLQSTVKEKAGIISSLESQASSLKFENDELEVEINAGINYQQLYDIAVEELGMKYPNSKQVITFDAGESEYVKQYKDIPQ